MKQKTRTKLWISLAAIVLAAALCCIMTYGYQDFNPYCWFGHNYSDTGVCARCGKDKPGEPAEPEQADGNVVLTPIASQYMLLKAAPVALADNPDTYTLTATITPASADDKRVEWSVGWKDNNAMWAIGKNITDYVTVTPVSEHALTATVACIKDFGEQVIVTVTSLDNEAVTATCTVDYVRRITSLNINVAPTNAIDIPFTYEISYSNYTIAGEEYFDCDYLYRNCDDIDPIEDYLYRWSNSHVDEFHETPAFIYASSGVPIEIDFNNQELHIGEFDTISTVTPYYPINDGILGRFVRVTQEVDNEGYIPEMIYEIRQILQTDNAPDAYFKVTFGIKYAGKTYGENKLEVDVTFDADAMHISVSSIGMSQSSIIV